MSTGQTHFTKISWYLFAFFRIGSFTALRNYRKTFLTQDHTYDHCTEMFANWSIFNSNVELLRYWLLGEEIPWTGKILHQVTQINVGIKEPEAEIKTN